VKVDPGSNVHGDNEPCTLGGMQDIDIAEPKQAENGMLRRPMCSRVFSSRKDDISHTLSQNQPATAETQMGAGNQIKT